MARHQIIYTSCRRGIDGMSDGQQVYSYDKSFSDRKDDDVRGLFSYQVPSLPAGTLMSDETARMMPAAFLYRRLKSGSAAVALNTYLGRDYMGGAGRFGNHLSHAIVCDFEDFDVYPCEMYGSTALRSGMRYEEVNDPNPPAHLPVPELTKGERIDAGSVAEFLGIGGNLESYKKMAAAMLRFRAEKKRILICDEPDNIVRWIAALHYALPLDIAKGVSFTTYEHNPELSPAQICGVVPEGSRYSAGEYIASGRYYVFDFFRGEAAQAGAEDPFLDFLDTAFSFSFEILREFHAFVMEKTSYRSCDEGYRAAYALYRILADGISDIPQEQFVAAADFADAYLTDGARRELADRLSSEGGAIGRLDNGYALRVLGFLLRFLKLLAPARRLAVKQMIVDRLIRALSEGGAGEQAFLPLYDRIDGMAREIGLSIPAELMEGKNRESLLGVLARGAELWKALFLIRIVGGYVKDRKLSADELLPDRAVGAVYFGIVNILYDSNRKDGRRAVEGILDGFRDSPVYCVNMALNLEGFQRDRLEAEDSEVEDSDTPHLWQHFFCIALSMDASGMESVGRILLESDRYDEMYELYDRRIRSMETLAETGNFFADYWKKWFVGHEGYGSACAVRALRDYAGICEGMAGTVPEKEAAEYASEILQTAMKMELKEDYMTRLSRAVCGQVPFGQTDPGARREILAIYEYQRDVLQAPAEGRLLLLAIAFKLQKASSRKEVLSAAQELQGAMGADGRARFGAGMEDGAVRDYFEWAFAPLQKLRLSAEELDALSQLFSLAGRARRLFLEYWCRTTHQRGKDSGDYKDFGEFLAFLFRAGDQEDREMAGRYLGRASRQKLELLEAEMEKRFADDRKASRAWEDMKGIAFSRPRILNNLSDLLKRK